MAKMCPQCKRRLADNEKFCPHCSDSIRTVPAPDDAHTEVLGPIMDAESELLAVEYNSARVFVEGTRMSFDLRITPGSEGIRNLFMAIRENGEPEVIQRPTSVLQAGVPLEIHLNYTPKHVGEPSFDVIVGYENRGETIVQEAAVKHRIYPPDAEPGEVCNQISLQINNEVSGNASDGNVNVAGLSKLQENINKHRTLRDCIDEVAGICAYKPLPMVKSTWRPPVKQELVEEVSVQGENSEDNKMTMRYLKWAAALVFVAVVAMAGFRGMTVRQKPEPPPVASNAPPVNVTVNVTQQQGDGNTVNAPKPPVVNLPVVSPAVTFPQVASQSDLVVSVDTVDGKRSFREGELIVWNLVSSRDCYVALICHQSDGTDVLLFPNHWNQDAFVKGGKAYRIPGDSKDGFEIVASPPYGRDEVEVIASATENDFHKWVTKQLLSTSREIPFSAVTRGEVKTALTRGMRGMTLQGKNSNGTVVVPGGWYRQSLRVTTKR